MCVALLVVLCITNLSNSSETQSSCKKPCRFGSMRRSQGGIDVMAHGKVATAASAAQRSAVSEEMQRKQPGG